MTKIIVDLVAPAYLDDCVADGIILSDPIFSTFPGRTYNLHEIKKMASEGKKRGLKVIINIDRIIEEDELTALNDILSFYLTLDIDFYIYSDFAVLAFFSEKKCTDKLIYNPKTLIANSEDAKIHRQWGSLVAVSNEIAWSEIKEIVAAGNVGIEVYGHRQIFYSRRPLLSAFNKHAQLELMADTRYKIREEQRNDYYSIYQSAFGTQIYTDYRVALFCELPELLPSIAFLKINGAFVPASELAVVVALYKKFIVSPVEAEELYLQLQAVYSNIGPGYLSENINAMGDNND